MKHGVKVCFRNKAGRILLLHRDKNAPSAPLTWTMPGGGVHKGESPIDAAKRESKEEIGHFPEKLELITEAKSEHLKFTLYYAELNKTLSELVLGEGDGMEFFSFEEAYNLPMGIEARMCLDLARIHLETTQTKPL